MDKSSIRADISQNRIYITFFGCITKKESERLYTDIRFGVADLSPNFDVISDFRNCSFAAVSNIPTYRKIVRYLIDNKVRRVVRIVDREKLISQQLLNLSLRCQGYSSILVESLEEAERELQQSAKRADLRFYLYDHQVYYYINDTKFQGEVVDISTSGCAVRSSSELPVLGDIVFITVDFHPHESLAAKLETKAKVVNVQDDGFAVHFHEFHDDQKEALRQRLVHESHCEITS